MVDRYKGMVYAVAYARLGSFEDARDVAQNVFVTTYLHLHSLRDDSKVAAWLRSVTVRACMAYRRAAPPCEPLDPMLMQPDEITPLLNRLLVSQALRCLSDEIRATVVLYYFQSYSVAETAALLEVPVTAVKSRLRDARARLKKEMMRMVETTLEGERLGDDFAARVQALADAAVAGKLDSARELVAGDPSLVHGYGEIDDEHMRQHDAHHGWTPLHLAAHYGHMEIVRLLVEHGADVNAVAQNSIGNTPISAAGWSNHIDIVEYLLQNGAEVDIPNKWGSTALHRAVDASRVPLAELLLRHGADPLRPTGEGKTALDRAREVGDPGMISLLEQYTK
jgi:RNA polymerase sigma factor (sigma-70 family)